MNRALKTLFLAFITLPAWAQAQEQEERWYEVEIILFEHLNPVALESETWPLDIIEPDLEGSLELLRKIPEQEKITDDGKPVPYLILPPEQYQLKGAYRKLLNSDNYLPYVHVAWRQVIPPRGKEDRIFIHDQLNSPIDEDTIDAEKLAPRKVATPPANTFLRDDMFIETPLEFSPPAHTLSGVLSVGLGRYLHVEADLLLYKPELASTVEEEFTLPPLVDEFQLPEQFSDQNVMEPVAEEIQIPEFFRIQGNMRMRSTEVHYLDHPLVGMLILFTPYTLPEPEIEETTSDMQEEIDMNQTRPTPTSG